MTLDKTKQIWGLRNVGDIKVYRKNGEYFVSERSGKKLKRMKITSDLAVQTANLSHANFVEQCRQLIDGGKMAGSANYYEIWCIMTTECLTSTELSEITGYKHTRHQRDWLDKNGWEYVLNRAGRPIVGRFFARMKLAGASINQNTATTWTPDFSNLT